MIRMVEFPWRDEIFALNVNKIEAVRMGDNKDVDVTQIFVTSGRECVWLVSLSYADVLKRLQEFEA